MRVKCDEIGKAAEKILAGYEGATVATMKKAIDKSSKQSVKELKADSPKRTGAYGKSWTSKVDAKTSVLAYSKIVYNKKHYRLTHLLEKGHRKVNGGFVAARPHIAKVEQDAIETLVKEIEKNV